MEKWILRNRNTVIEGGEFLNISKGILKILINRGFKSFDEISSYINPNKSTLKNSVFLKDLDKSISILKNLKKNGGKLRIVGDYDVDGIISVYILYRTFKNIGFDVDFVIPDRIKEGYGINEKIVYDAKKDNVDVIITCDNGIAAITPIKLAKELNLTVIVTDHHDVHIEFDEKNNKTIPLLPEADAILNPKQEDCEYKFKKLCGAGVCFKLCEELYKHFNIKDDVMELLEFVTIATICDIVDLEDENRFIVKYGMDLINNTCNNGINAIIDVNNLTKGSISSYEIGYIIGPCFNAVGRISTAKTGIELLLSEDFNKAYDMALEIKGLNDKRKSMTLEAFEECLSIIEENFYYKSNVIVVYNPNIHESIAGIVAGRIKERYHRPTIVITKGEKICKGSARSVENVNIFEILFDNKSLLGAFGGHPMAAGLSIKEDNINRLRESLNQSHKINDDDLVNIVYVDMYCPIQNIDYNFVRDLFILEPFGKSNSKPILGDKNVRICSIRRIGKSQNYISFKLLSNDGKIFDFVYFGDANEFDEDFKKVYGDEQLKKFYSGRYIINSDCLMDILYYVKLDTYNLSETIKYFLFKYRFSKVNI